MQEQPEMGEWRAGPAVGRAGFLKAAALAVIGFAAGYAPAAAAASLGEAAVFLKLSRIASGANDLSPALAKRYSAALEAQGALKMKPSHFAKLAGVSAHGGPASLAELERSPAFHASGGKECLEAIAAAWWSGIVPVPGGGQQVITFSDALVFREVHQSASCIGATGSWAKPGRAAT